MNDPEFSNYTSSEKRFEISKDSFSRERLRIVKELAETLKERMPARIAVSLYGSLSKGRELSPKNAEDSDIDLMVYIDINDATAAHKSWLENDTRYAAIYLQKINKTLQRIQRQFGGRPLDTVMKLQTPDGKLATITLGEHIATVEKQAIWAAVQRYAKDIIDTTLNSNQEITGYDHNTNHILIEPISESGPESIGAIAIELANAIRSNDQRTADAIVTEQIGPYFTLDITGGLRKYRQYFLLQLQAMEDRQAAEYIWQAVNNAVREVERGHNIPATAERQFPNTLEKALRYYGVTA